MTPEEYAAEQAVIAAAAAAYAAQLSGLFQTVPLSPSEWTALLGVAFPQVLRFREQSAQLARTFYDQQRFSFHPELPRNDQYLEELTFEKFVIDMEPVRVRLSVKEATAADVSMFALQFVREVENAGRRQIIRAVENDEPLREKLRDRPQRTEKRQVRGWARVATGRETCAWCLMLVSRGPVYYSAESAGLDLDDVSAKDAYLGDQDVSEFMNDWHTGCDCKVIPVFDLRDWPGKEAQERATALWVTAGKRATAELKENPDKEYYSFKEKRWLPTTDNRETINQLRKMIEAGEVNQSDWAVLNQAA